MEWNPGNNHHAGNGGCHIERYRPPVKYKDDLVFYKGRWIKREIADADRQRKKALNAKRRKQKTKQPRKKALNAKRRKQETKQPQKKVKRKRGAGKKKKKEMSLSQKRKKWLQEAKIHLMLKRAERKLMK